MPLPSWATSTPAAPTPLNLAKAARDGLPGQNIELRGQTLLIRPLEAESYDEISDLFAMLCRRADSCNTRIEIWLPVVNGHLATGLERHGFRIAITDHETEVGPHHILRRPPTLRSGHTNTA